LQPITGAELLGGLGVLDDGADLRSHELGGGLVGLRREEEVVECSEEGEPAFLPAALVDLGAGLLVDVESTHQRLTILADMPAEARGRLAGHVAPRVVLGLDSGHLGRVEWPVVGGHRVRRGPLEHRDVFGLLGDEGDGLDRRRARTDHSDAPTGEIDTVMGPVPGVVGVARELVTTGDVGHVGGRQATGGHHHETGPDVLSAVGRDRPPWRIVFLAFVEVHRRDPGVERDRVTQVEAVGDVLDVAKDLGLGGIALGPIPFALKVLVEAEGVLERGHVAAGARIAVPVPGAANARSSLDHPSGEPERADRVQHVEPGEPGSHDRDININIPGHVRRFPSRVVCLPLPRRCCEGDRHDGNLSCAPPAPLASGCVVPHRPTPGEPGR
jgi:hypothetical protein